MILKKLIRQMLLTQIVSEMIVTICMLIDTIMIGRLLGIESMSAYGYSAPIILIFSAVSAMICAGSQVMCGKTLAVGDKEGTNSNFSTSILYSLIFSVVGISIIVLFSNQICTFLGAGINSPDNPIFDLTKQYLFGFLIGAPAFMIMKLMVPYMQIAGERKYLLITILFMSLADIIFNYVNVVYLNMGIFGMGFASALSYYTAVIISVIFFARKIRIFNFKLSLVKLQTIFNILKSGTPMFILHICLALLPLIRNALLTKYGGSVAVASYSIISTVSNICYAPIVALMSITLTLTSMFYADKEKNSLKQSLNILIKYAVIICLIIDLVLLLATKPIVMAFINDISTLDMTMLGLRIFSLSLIPCAINVILTQYYQGIGHTKLSIVATIMESFVISAVCVFILSYFLGITGIWISIVFSEIATLAFICIYAFIKNKKISFKLDNFLLLPKDFEIDENNCYNVSTKSQIAVINASNEAYDFCINRGIERKKANIIALSIEEIGNNIIKYGFVDDKNYSIDIRIVISKDSIILRIKDNCLNFDPVKYVELHQDDDPFAHIGIRMVMKLVKNADYSSTFGLNNLMLEL